MEIAAVDSLKFDPAEITVKAGEPVRFVVRNTGSTTHEFVLGDEEVSSKVRVRRPIPDLVAVH